VVSFATLVATRLQWSLHVLSPNGMKIVPDIFEYLHTNNINGKFKHVGYAILSEIMKGIIVHHSTLLPHGPKPSIFRFPKEWH